MAKTGTLCSKSVNRLSSIQKEDERYRSFEDFGKLKRHANMNVFKNQQVLDIMFNSII